MNFKEYKKDDPHGAAKALILFKDKYLLLLRSSNDAICLRSGISPEEE